MELCRRERYLAKTRGFFHDEGTIKVISGVRWCGESCMPTSSISWPRRGASRHPSGWGKAADPRIDAAGQAHLPFHHKMNTWAHDAAF